MLVDAPCRPLKISLCAHLPRRVITRQLPSRVPMAARRVLRHSPHTRQTSGPSGLSQKLRPPHLQARLLPLLVRGGEAFLSGECSRLRPRPQHQFGRRPPPPPPGARPSSRFNLYRNRRDACPALFASGSATLRHSIILTFCPDHGTVEGDGF